jgi:predicted RNA-binding Zn-ribbon protein involved in translation (DUF1610 family)
MGNAVVCPHCGQSRIYHAREFSFFHPLEAVHCPICGWMQYRCVTVRPDFPAHDAGYTFASPESRQRIVAAARSNGKRTTRDALRAANERIKAAMGE